MDTLITNRIKISVEVYYQADHSRPAHGKYIHSYRITIENQGDSTVQLLRRYWRIWDSTGVVREVEGEGVIGLQPVLAPGQQHSYMSWCPLNTDLGKMSGHYVMQRQSTGERFKVIVPEFRLIAPFKEN